MSINRQCLDDAYDGTNDQGLNPDGSCKDFPATEGSLKAMQVDGTPLLLGVHMTFANPDDRRASYWVKCGAAGGDAPDMFEEGTDLLRATCQAADVNGCSEWFLTPATADESLQCRLSEKTNKSLTKIADYYLSFDLRLYRDQP